MNFPQLLRYAVMRGNQVCFPRKVLDQGDEWLVEYMEWKRYWKIDVLTKRKLRHFLKKKQYYDGICQIFINSSLGTLRVGIKRK